MHEEWRQVQLGNLASTARPAGKPENGQVYVGLEHMDSGSPSISRTGSTDNVESSATPFKVGDVLFGKLRPYLRKVAVPDFSGVCTNEVLVYRSSTKELEQSYLALVLQTNEFFDYAINGSAGSRMPRTSVNHLSLYQFSLPPVVEQRRIVDIINAMDHAIELAGARTSISLYDQLLAEFMGHSEKSHLDRAVVQSKVQGQVQAHSHYLIYGVARSGLGLINPTQTPGAKTKYTKLTRLNPNQFVYRKLTAWEGPLTVAPADMEPGWVTQEFPVFDVNEDVLLPGLLRHMCRWPGFWREIKNLLTGTVERRKRLNPQALLKVKVPMPSIEHQRHILGILDEAYAAIKVARVHESSLSELRSHLLATLLSGEHEIPEAYDALIGA